MNLKEFSEAIGVSPTTVSRSLSRRGRISDETREMVLRRMDELGYRPNLHAQRLVSGRANMVVLDFKDMSLFTETFSVQLMQGIANALQEESYGLLLSAQGHTALRHWAKSRAVDGVIAIGGEDNVELAEEITAMGVPCVILGTNPFYGIPNAGSVHIDLKHGARQVARYLAEIGHTRIGFINSSTSHSVLNVFRAELALHGVQLEKEYIAFTGDTPLDGEKAALKLLSLPKPPTAIFLRTDELAIGALRVARRLDLKVPQDLSIVGHDDVPYAMLTEPVLTTVRVPVGGIGRLASRMLLKLLDSPGTMQEPLSEQTELVIRDTVAPPAKGR